MELNTTSHALERLKSKFLTMLSAGEAVKWLALSYAVGEYFGYWQFCVKLNKQLRNPAIPPLGVCPRKMDMCVHEKTCTGRFIMTFVIIAHNWK